MISNCLVNRLIHYCDEQYRSDNCQYDANSCAELRCFGNCKECLNQIHFPGNYQGRIKKDDYDCKKILFFYVCDYLVKYASEMYYLLVSENIISKINYLRILSIGCGDCPDLIAFEEYFKNSNIINVDYLGVDTNERWVDINNIIREYYNNTNRNFNINFLYDSFVGFDIDKYQPNFVVIQYLFSYLYLHNKQFAISQIVDKINNYIFNACCNKPIFILINDVNSINAGRDVWINQFIEKLSNPNIKIITNKYYFNYNEIN